MRVLLGAGLLALAVLVPLGCGTDDASDDYDLFYSDWVHAICDKAERCCRLPGFDFSTCPSQIGDPMLSALKRVDRRHFAFHEDRADACLRGVRANAHDCSSESSAVCQTVFEGLLPPGALCSEHVECRPPAPGMHGACGSDDDGYARCVGPAKLGEPCGTTCDENEICQGADDGVRYERDCWVKSGLYCGAQGVCEPLIANGQPCDHLLRGPQCELGSQCWLDVCTAPPSAGESCSASGICEKGAYCPGATHVCAPRIATSAPCEEADHDQCVDGVCEDGRCNAAFDDSWCSDGTGGPSDTGSGGQGN